jgi:hypothetical protein
MPHSRQYSPNHASQEAVLPLRKQYYLSGGSTALIMPHRRQSLPLRRQYSPNHASQEAVLPLRRQYCPNHASQEAVPQEAVLPLRKQYYLSGGSTALIMPHRRQYYLSGGSTRGEHNGHGHFICILNTRHCCMRCDRPSLL